MKTNLRFFTTFSFCLLILSCVIFTNTQSASFTYQGKLNDNIRWLRGQMVTGRCFRLMLHKCGGLQPGLIRQIRLSMNSSVPTVLRERGFVQGQKCSFEVKAGRSLTGKFPRNSPREMLCKKTVATLF